jgi:hypothetical protein
MDLQALTGDDGSTTLQVKQYPDGTVRQIPLARASMAIPPDEAEDAYLVGKELALSVLLPALAKASIYCQSSRVFNSLTSCMCSSKKRMMSEPEPLWLK